MVIMNTKYTVIGAGHGGKAMAAHLALMGFPVTLWNRSFEHIEIIKKRGGIALESTERGDSTNLYTTTVVRQTSLSLKLKPLSTHLALMDQHKHTSFGSKKLCLSRHCRQFAQQRCYKK